MNNKSFVYYGYERNTFEDCASLIVSFNRRHMDILNIWFTAIAAVYLLFSWQNSFGFSRRDTPLFILFFISGVIFEVILLRIKDPGERLIPTLKYINMALMITFGIICSAAQPYMAATVFPVILMIVALSYIGTMVNMSMTLIGGSAVFLAVSYMVKPGSIFNQDLLNTLVVLLLSLVLHYTFQRSHIRQFITYRQSSRMQHQLEIKSSFDALTSLLNRGRFFSMAGEILKQGQGGFMVLGLMDLDKFKRINDELGHQMGDKVIQIAGRTVLTELNIDYGDKWSFPERAVRERLNFAGRLGGDEFIVLLRNYKDEDDVKKAFEAILSSLNGIRLEGLEGIQASIGVTEISADDRDLDSAYSRADEALYRSKESGRNTITFYSWRDRE